MLYATLRRQKQRIKSRLCAEAIARAADGYRGPLGIKVEHCRQGPPKLFDLPSSQKTCGQRWGWTADKTLAIAQELYDGDGKKLITYPRAEARYLSENQIADVPAIAAALGRLRGFAHLDLSKPVIRKGKSGHFCDRALKGVSHHAVVPNVNALDGDLEKRLARLSYDEKRLFAIICRSYLAAVMPDYEYRQTAVTMQVPVPPGEGAEFRAVGRIPLVQGWKAVYGASEPDAGGDETEQALPPLTGGEMARLTEPRIDEKRTQAPPRYNEGTLIDAMQNAWRFVENPAVRERLKEAKGIGTPATRAEIIKGLKKQNLLAADGKWVVPTGAGLQLFELLRGAAPALVDPGTTAEWEMQLDAVVTGEADHRRVIDAIAAEAEKLIGVLQQSGTSTVKLEAVSAKPEPRKRRSRKAAAAKHDTRAKPSRRKAASAKPKRLSKSKAAQAGTAAETAAAARAAPTARMIAYAEKLAKTNRLPLPPGYAQDFQTCRRFLDQYG